MTAPHSNMKPKQQIMEVNKSTFKLCPCMPLRVACLIMGYLTLLYTSILSVGLLGFIVWFLTDMEIRKGSDKLTEFFFSHMLSISIFVMLLNGFAMVLTIVCLVGIYKKTPRLMVWHISFTAARTLIVVATLVYNLLTGLNFGLLVGQLIVIGTTIYYIYVLKTYMDELQKEVKEASEKCDSKDELKKVPIV